MSLSRYYALYLAGSHEQVWQDLFTLGSSVRQEPLFSDARMVAREAMRRSYHNTELIVSKLKESGYVFASSKILVKAQPNIFELLDSLEKDVGPIPMSVRAWYELVDKIDITGTHPQWKVCGCPPLCADLNPSFRSRIIFDFEMTYEKRAQVIRSNPDMNNAVKQLELEKLRKSLEQEKLAEYGLKPFVSTAGFQFTSSYLRHYGKKESDYPFNAFDYRKNEPEDLNPYGITIMSDVEVANGGFPGTSEIIAPDSNVDGRFRYPQYNLAPTFVNYLRVCFEWGGFPGFANVDPDLRPTEMLEYLKEGLLPI